MDITKHHPSKSRNIIIVADVIGTKRKWNLDDINTGEVIQYLKLFKSVYICYSANNVTAHARV